MNHDELLGEFDRRMRREARPDGPSAKVERTGGVVRHVGTEHGWNGVIWSDLDAEGADAAIAEQVRYFGSLGRAFEWKLYGHDRPADLDRRLLAAGFTPEPAETLMVASVAQIAGGTPPPRNPGSAQPPHATGAVHAARPGQAIGTDTDWWLGTGEAPAGVEVPEGVRLVRVTGRDGVELVADVHERVFGAPRHRMRESLLDQLAAGTLIAVVAMAGDVPISAARMDLHPGTGFASLWGGGTLPEWRGRGVYRSLVACRARLAAALGYEYLQVDASSESRPILSRLGFVALTTTTPYVHP
ncbi:GNAT family N-acetyltransferase [Nonomuraea sp. H19]|uniref:GNAT family N-acetyltransferase n=1 Tax=Nonomuraea sp. H19 TaxID=3452206 RepID=UPI003F892711